MRAKKKDIRSGFEDGRDSATLRVLPLAACLAAAAAGLSAAAAAGAPDVTIAIDAAGTGPAVNRLVLGSNVEWIYNGDNMLSWDTFDFEPAMKALAVDMGPTSLRYPGGDQSDLYNWFKGIGPPGVRESNLQAISNSPQMTYMGTAELLELSEYTGAAPLITINVVSGSPAGAANWVHQTNVARLHGPSGQLLPKVTYWEIGNEPYYPNPDGSDPWTCIIDPHTYVAKANADIKAMRAVDPGIKIGIALANDTQNGIQNVSPGCEGFSDIVLTGLKEPVDFVSIHDAYLPYDPTGQDHPAADEYAAAMGSTHEIETDFAAMRALLKKFPKVAALPFAVTEYNALFSLNPGSAYAHSMASPMGALYVADALRFFASRDDVLMAHAWSLSNNDHWGAIYLPPDGSPPYGRPSYQVFRLFGEALQGTRLTATVTSPSFDAPDLGFSGAASGLPTVTTLVTRTAGAGGVHTLRVAMINKDYKASHVAAVKIAGGTVSSAHLSLLTAANVLESDGLPGSFRRSESDLDVAGGVSATLPAHSVALLTVQLAAAP